VTQKEHPMPRPIKTQNSWDGMISFPEKK